jgi:hypothetical protein
MNSLSYRTHAENGLSFEWLMDSQSLPALLGLPEDERLMPYWVWLSGLPSGAQIDDEEGRVLISACSCGESGCGHTSCVLTQGPDVLTFSGFWSDQVENIPELAFSVSVQAFHVVAAEIVEASRGYDARARDSAALPQT